MRAGLPFVLAVVGALALPQAVAAAVVYDEAIDGDAGTGTGIGANLAPPVITLGGGVNQILGSLTFSNNPQIQTDIDAFGLVVGAGKSILSISISTALRDEGGGQFSLISWMLRIGAKPTSGATPIPTIGTPLFGSLLPLGEGTYRLSTIGLGGVLSDGQYRIADYTVSVDVEATPTPVPVPLPAGAALLAASLGLLALLRRRRT